MAALVLAAAVTLSGECGPLGLNCELAVARTCANRMADERWPDDLGGVLTGYYGRDGVRARVVCASSRVVDGRVSGERRRP